MKKSSRKQHQYAAIQMQPISIEILLRNQEISSVSAVPTARSPRLHDYIGVVCNLQRPKSGCFEVFEDAAAAKSSRTITLEGWP